MRQGLLTLFGVLLILVGGLIPLSTALMVFILPETFASTARIIPAVTEPPAFDTEIQKLQSKVVLHQVITNLSLNKKWAEKMKMEDLPSDLSYAILKNQLTVHRYATRRSSKSPL